MAEFAKELLSQYYGIGTDSSKRRFPTGPPDEKNSKDEEIDKETRGDSEDEDSARQETQESSDSSEEFPLSSESFGKLPLSIDIDSSEEINKYSSLSDLDLGPNIIRNACPILPPSAEKDSVTKIGISTSKALLEPQEYIDGNEGSLIIIDDGIPDSLSDVSSIAVESKKSRKSLISCATPLPSTPAKVPIYTRNYVDLSAMGLTLFPTDVLDKFSLIRMLYLNNNQLETLPDEIFTVLQHLEWLDVRINRIKVLPATIKSHPCLESLLLEGNNIEKLPLELCTLRKLKTLHVAQNPLEASQKEIAALGLSAIMSFLRNEWNKLHPEEPVVVDEEHIEPKWSSLLCYESSSKSKLNSKALGSRSSLRASKKALLSEGGSKNNRYTTVESTYYNKLDRTLVKVPCKVCTQIPEKRNASTATQTTFDVNQSAGRRKVSFLELLCSKEPLKQSRISQINGIIGNKVLRLQCASPRSLYVRQNIMFLKTYQKGMEKDCRLSGFNRKLRSITVGSHKRPRIIKASENSGQFAETETIFDIITVEGRRLKLRPLRLKSPDWILSCLENYIRQTSKHFRPKATKDQQLAYMSKLREILHRQAIKLQRTKDEDTRKEWRQDTRSFSKAMEKANCRNEDDIPFGIDATEYASIFKEASKSKKLATDCKKSLIFVPPANIDDRISEVLECVNRLQMPKSREMLSPRVKQKILKKEMNKLTELQQEIQFLKKYSDLVLK